MPRERGLRAAAGSTTGPPASTIYASPLRRRGTARAQPFRVPVRGSVALAYADDRSRFLPAVSRPVFPDHPRSRRPHRQPLRARRRARRSKASASAPAVVLAAWRRWGLDCGAHLLGDFVVVVSDEAARRVVCIRDPMGQRPLFYGASARAASSLDPESQQVVRSARRGVLHVRRPMPNEGMVAEYLTGDPATVAETLWRGVYRLPPAHTLEITPERCDGARATGTSIPSARVRTTPSAGEYADHFREVFTRAVECRVRDAGRAWRVPERRDRFLGGRRRRAGDR